MKKSHLLFLGTALIVTSALFFLRNPRESSAPIAEPLAADQQPSFSPPLPDYQPPPAYRSYPPPIALPSGEDSSIIAGINAPDTQLTDDLVIVKSVLHDYRSTFKSVPMGTHEEVVARLSGQNDRSIIYIPADHPTVRDGLLLDRFGTPFIFHTESATRATVRSAGPDLIAYTEDDVFTD